MIIYVYDQLKIMRFFPKNVFDSDDAEDAYLQRPDESRCIFEARGKTGKYHVIDRLFPGKNKEYIELIKYLLDLAGMDAP